MTTSDLSLPAGERDYALGEADAPVTLVEYGDYECGDCAVFHGLLAEVIKQLGPKLRFVYRHLPWTKIHPLAQAAAEASFAAGAQGRFWEMHDLLYSAAGRLATEDLVRYAEQLGLDVARFEQELSQGTHKARVLEDLRTAVRSGVKRTPALFINGSSYTGDWRDQGALIGALQAAAASS